MMTGAQVERWACNLAGPFPKLKKGHLYILKAICVFTNYIFLVPLGAKKAVTDAIYEKVFLKFGAGEILADNRGNSAASF